MNEEPRPPKPKEISFRIGDVFDPDDDLSLWFCTIALAFNDIVFTHTRADEATDDWERFYFSRVGIGHYNEILLFMERNRNAPAIEEFIASSDPSLQEAYDEALARYEANRVIANRLRNQAIFHYPNRSGVQAMRVVLRDSEVQDDRGGVTSATGKVRDARLHYADEVMAKMVINALGGTRESAAGALAELSEGVTTFMRFANAAQDEFLVRKLG